MRLKLMAVMITAVFAVYCCGCTGTPDVQSEIVSSDSEPQTPDASTGAGVWAEIGNPLKNTTSKSTIARFPADMIVFDGALHICYGEWNENSGPITMKRYDLTEEKWINGSVLPEEAVLRFNVADGALYCTGIDAQEDWSRGNYYTYSDGEWKKHRDIPGGVHVFDIEKHGDDLFFGIGTAGNEDCAVVIRADGTAETLAFVYEDGSAPKYDSANYSNERCYDLFAAGNDLFAIREQDIYKWDGEKFVFNVHWDGFANFDHFSGTQYLQTDLAFGKYVYFPIGMLYRTADGTNVEYLPLPDEDYGVTDAYADGGRLFVLAARMDGDGFESVVYELNDGDGFEKIAEYRGDAPAISLAADGNDLYIALARKGSDDSGMILKYEVD